MKRIAFTVAYGKKRYRRMAKVLGLCMKEYSPNVEFRIYGDAHTVSRPIVKPKDTQRGKIEICRSLNEPGTQYIFVDSDSFVFCDISRLFHSIEKDAITLIWRESPNGKWDGVEDLDFPLACRKAGIQGEILPYHINSGFMMWQGGIPVFDKALELFDNYDIPDRKGMRGDEYYICAAIQLTGTRTIPLQDIEDNPLRVYWIGNLSVKDGRLFSDAYETQGLVQHYGSKNWEHKSVRTVAKRILAEARKGKKWFRRS